MATTSTSEWRIFGDIITIEAGTEPTKSFTIHESLLQRSPTFFRAALSKTWKENLERKIRLFVDDAQEVGVYIEWLYSGRVQFPIADVSSIDYANLYVFGEKYQDIDYCNAVMSAWCDFMDRKNCVPRPRAIQVIYEGTPEGSVARKWMVTIANEYWDESDWHSSPAADKDILLTIPDFLYDVATCRALPVGKHCRRRLTSRQDEWLKK